MLEKLRTLFPTTSLYFFKTHSYW